MSLLPHIIRRLVVYTLLALWLLSVGAAAPALAQNNNTGAVTGRINDPSDKPLPDIAVTAINTGNGAMTSTRTSLEGTYLFQYLPPGNYQIEAAGRPHQYPSVVITVEVPLNNTQNITLPDITLGRVLLVVRVLGPTGKLLPQALVETVNVIRNRKENPTTRNNGEHHYRYLENGSYRLSACACIDRQGYRTKTFFPISIKVSENWEEKNWGRKEVELRLDGKSIGSCAALADVCSLPPAAIGGEAERKDLTTIDQVGTTLGTEDSGESGAVSPRRIDQNGVVLRSTFSQEADLGQSPAPTSPRPALPPQSPPVPKVEVGAANLLLVNTTSAARSINFTERQIGALPLGGRAEMRTYDELAFLAPGVAPPPYTFGPRGPGVGFGVNTAGDFSVNGMRARANNFTVDGSDNNDPDVGGRRQGFVALVPQPLESINGFSLSTLLWNAELGRNFGSQVNAVSRYGENAYHGQAYTFFTDSRLNARNFFDYTCGVADPMTRTQCGKDPMTRTQKGFVIGGPLIRSLTHFFGSLERVDTSASTEQHFATPTTEQRRFATRNPPSGRLGELFGVFPFSADAKDKAGQVYRTTLAGTPVGRLILDFYPFPNLNPSSSLNPLGPYGQNTYTEVIPADGDGTILSARVTHQFAPNNLLNARYNFTNDHRTLPSVNRAIHSTINAAARTQNLSLIFDGALGARRFLQARFSYGRTRLGFTPYLRDDTFSNMDTDDIVGLGDDIPSMTGPIGALLIEPFSQVGIDVFTFPQRRVNNTFQFGQAVSYPVGSHAIRFGSDILRFQFNSLQNRNYRPLAIYGYAIQANGRFRDEGEDVGFSFEERTRQIIPGVQLAALGVASSILQTLTTGPPESIIGLRSTQYSFFVTDNWRIRPRLSLDYGLRYEYNTVPREVNNRIERALRLENLPEPGASLFDTPARTAKFNAAVNEYKLILDGRTSIYDPDRNNFGPHLGFAWAPWDDSKTAVRGGYGLYYGVILGALVSQSRNVFPAEIPVNVDPLFVGFNVFNLNNPALLGALTGDLRGLPNPPLPLIAPKTLNQLAGARIDFASLVGELFLRNGAGGGLAFALPNKNLPTPYSQQWHLTVERELFGDYLISAAYVGTKGTKLTRLTTPNLGPQSTAYIPVVPVGLGSPLQYPFVATAALNYPVDAQRTLTRLALQPNRTKKNLGAYQIFENSAGSIYHALQLEARKRYARSYTLTAAYTWSHAIDEVSDIFPLAGAPNLPQNSIYPSERASANFDLRHRFAASLVWELPFYRETTGRKARWLGGWQLATIFQAQTGQPFTFNLPFDANRDGNLTDRPSTLNGLTFNSAHGPQKITPSNAKVEDFLVICPTNDELCADSVVGRNTARGDGLINWDLALTKKFRFTIDHQLEFRTEFFNLSNRANFGLPIRTIGSPGFGAAVDTVTPARIIQFALKYSF